MPRILMVPLDGSACAEQALPLALSMARRSGALLHLVTVSSSWPLDGRASDELYLEQIAEQVGSGFPGRVTHQLLRDEFGPLENAPPGARDMAGMLARHAVEHAVDFIVMMTHGRGGLRRAWIGSVTDSLLRIAPVPVVVRRPVDEHVGPVAAPAGDITHIVVPLDGSVSAAQVIPFAQRLGEPFGASYTLVRVVTPFTWHTAVDAYGAPPTLQPPQAISRDAVAAYLESIATPLRATGLAVSTAVLEAAAPAPAILHFAAMNGADMIALSTAGAGGMTRMLLGSVTDRIVRSGVMPVLVCNPRHMVPRGAGAGADLLARARGS